MSGNELMFSERLAADPPGSLTLTIRQSIKALNEELAEGLGCTWNEPKKTVCGEGYFDTSMTASSIIFSIKRILSQEEIIKLRDFYLDKVLKWQEKSKTTKMRNLDFSEILVYVNFKKIHCQEAFTQYLNTLNHQFMGSEMTRKRLCAE